MARGDKKAKVIAYIRENPSAKNAEIAKACGCSVPMISVVKRELRNSGTRGSKNTSKKVAKKTAIAVDANSIEHVAAALEYVDSADALLELLSHVEAAGGVVAVESALEFHHRLSELIG